LKSTFSSNKSLADNAGLSSFV